MKLNRYWLVFLSLYATNCHSSIHLLKTAVRLAGQQHTYAVLGRLVHTNTQTGSSEKVKRERLPHSMKKAIAAHPTIAPHSTILLRSYELFKHTPGYHDTVQRILADAHCPSGVKGRTYELATAILLQQKGELVKALNKKVSCGNDTKEFDIVTDNLLVECKDIGWESNKSKLRRQMKAQAAVAQQRKKMNQEPYRYVVHSRQPIPPGWKKWLKRKNIHYHEE